MWHLPHASDVVGYLYQADLHCPDCMEIPFQHLADNRPVDCEAILDAAARKLGIDRYDETSYDSHDFPKIVFAPDANDDDVCGDCGEKLTARARRIEARHTTVGELKDGEFFSLDGGRTWYVCAVPGYGAISIYINTLRGDSALCVRIAAGRNDVCLVLGDSKRRAGGTEAYPDSICDSPAPTTNPTGMDE